jgi:hypothetical protein
MIAGVTEVELRCFQGWSLVAGRWSLVAGRWSLVALVSVLLNPS